MEQLLVNLLHANIREEYFPEDRRANKKFMTRMEQLNATFHHALASLPDIFLLASQCKDIDSAEAYVLFAVKKLRAKSIYNNNGPKKYQGIHKELLNDYQIYQMMVTCFHNRITPKLHRYFIGRLIIRTHRQNLYVPPGEENTLKTFISILALVTTPCDAIDDVLIKDCLSASPVEETKYVLNLTPAFKKLYCLPYDLYYFSDGFCEERKKLLQAISYEKLQVLTDDMFTRI